MFQRRFFPNHFFTIQICWYHVQMDWKAQQNKTEEEVVDQQNSGKYHMKYRKPTDIFNFLMKFG